MNVIFFTLFECNFFTLIECKKFTLLERNFFTLVECKNVGYTNDLKRCDMYTVSIDTYKSTFCFTCFGQDMDDSPGSPSPLFEKPGVLVTDAVVVASLGDKLPSEILFKA